MITQKLSIIIFFLLLIVVVSFLAYIIIGIQNDFQEDTLACEQIKECERYGCLAELSGFVSWKNNYLLQEQNCLLREYKK